MLLTVLWLLDVLMAPELPGRILAVTGAVATVLVAAGIGVWGIIGAWRVFLYLIGYSRSLQRYVRIDTVDN